MNFTTLCYIEKENQYLMLHRVSKKKDGNKDKWIGVGGHFEEGESPEDCLLREVREETGLELVNYQFRGIVTFISDKWEDEYMCLYTADKYIGEIGVCDEGELVWVEKDKIKDLNIWEGDKIFLRLLAENELFFSLKLEYQGENLINAILNGKEYRDSIDIKPEEFYKILREENAHPKRDLGASAGCERLSEHPTRRD